MSVEEAVAWLAHGARRVRRRQTLRLSLLALSVGLPAGAGVGALLAWPAAAQVLAGLVVTGAGLAFGLRRIRRWSVDAVLVAAHLDRTAPALEESTTLLLRPVDSLNLLERIQRRRVLDALGRLHRPLNLPDAGLRQAGGLLFLAMLLSVALAAWGPGRAFRGRTLAPTSVALHGGGPDTLFAEPPVRIQRVRVTLTPPAYAGQAPAVVETPGFEALQQTQAAWEVTLTRPVARAALIFSAGDTLVMRPTGEAAYRAGRQLQYSDFYFLETTSPGGRIYRSDYYPVTVVEDEPPVLTVVRPQQRTVIEPGERPHVEIEVFADDDLGLASARLVATVSKGAGESVRFREQTVAFDATAQRGRSAWTLTKTLDLEALGMERGDELYLFAAARDSRAPTPNEGRSETLFVFLRDTSQGAEVAGMGIVLDPAEAYLRSQRQIIIDTEKLIEEQAAISPEAFRRRSGDIGVDQKVLRLRYGQFLGEEFESSVADAEREAVPGRDAHEEYVAPREAPGAVGDAWQDLRSQFAHQHDTEEGATFYADDIKQDLKSALAEMWDAELRLRTFRPQEALPYEYEALRILKALQQKARIYVQRIGFEPPPLQPDERRLTGTLDDVLSRTDRQDRTKTPSFPAVREALVLLPRLEEGAAPPAAVAVLERAGRELAGVAIRQAGRYLPALRDLRVLIADLEAGRAPCRPCAASVQRACWNVLPPPSALPSRRAEQGTTLARRYFRAMSR